MASPTTSTSDPAVLTGLAARIASEAARFVKEALRRGDQAVTTKSSATDMVTDIDRGSEALIVAAVREARPLDGIVGEEGTALPTSTGVEWVIDPIDGTTNFVYGLPGFGVSVGVRLDGEVVAGAVADVLRGELFTATAGAGAFLNGTPIHVTAKSELATALVGTGFSYDSERRRRQAEVLAAVLPLIRDIRRIGAASTDLCAVACGRLDAYYEKGLAPWDYAAGALIAREAGAVVGNLDGGPCGPDFTLAAAPGVFGPLRDLLHASGAANA
ncbi:MAG: inositol monophosphatase family protein [Acidimicrobiia bacterium]